MLNILFLGASKRVSLFENIKHNIQATIKDDVNLYSIELDNKVPIRSCAEIIIGPIFGYKSFGDFLIDIVKKNKINIIIPCMESAVIVLSQYKQILSEKFNCLALVSNYDVVDKFSDKCKMAAIFDENNINHPKTINQDNFNIYEFPLIAKPKSGYGAKGQILLHNTYDATRYLLSNDYIIQKFISNAVEYSIDCYVSRDNKIICSVPRKRLEIINGEVSKTQVVKNKKIEAYAKLILSKFNFFGPITIQMFDSEEDPIVIEINLRFGGGVIASFLAGCKFGEWIYNDYVGNDNFEYNNWDSDFIMVRANREFIIK